MEAASQPAPQPGPPPPLPLFYVATAQSPTEPLHRDYWTFPTAPSPRQLQTLTRNHHLTVLRVVPFHPVTAAPAPAP